MKNLFVVIEDFAKWIEVKKDDYKDCLVTDLKIAAFRLVSKQKNIQLMKMVSDVYEFVPESRCFIPLMKVSFSDCIPQKRLFHIHSILKIQDLIDQKKFKEAGQFIDIMKLQSAFPNPETLLLPLILQNKGTIAEDLLKNQPDMQRALVTYLDNLLAPDKNSQVLLDKFIRYFSLII